MNRILIVDDDATIRLILQAHLSSRGFDCRLAADGTEALAILASCHIQVLITDLEMPGMSGIELLHAVRIQGLITRCVVVTGYSTVGNLTACLREGVVALVPKPLDDLAPLDRAVDQAFEQMQRWADQMGAIVRLRPTPPEHPASPPEPGGGHAL